jgi:metal-responsive CopG/Arc/MetJ family transcriptional regulator
MRTTITIDDELWEKVEHFFGQDKRNAVIRKALNEMVQREAGRRLASLGGSQPGFKAAPRRRSPDYRNPE